MQFEEGDSTMKTQYSLNQPVVETVRVVERSGLFSSLWQGFRRAIAGEEIFRLQMEARNLQIAVQTALNGAPITPPEVEQHIDSATIAVREAQHRQQRWQEDQLRLQQQAQVSPTPRQERAGNGGGYQERMERQGGSHLTLTETQQREQREQREREQQRERDQRTTAQG